LVTGGDELRDEVSGDLSVAAHDGDLAHAATLPTGHEAAHGPAPSPREH
jgi:hypothetical protein